LDPSLLSVPRRILESYSIFLTENTRNDDDDDDDEEEDDDGDVKIGRLACGWMATTQSSHYPSIHPSINLSIIYLPMRRNSF
jgi:hypothetical protein